jgi:phage repressor protein C with HTH and peptisase S24 domain
MSVKERLIEFIKHKNLSQGRFEKKIGLSNGYVNNIRVSIQPDTLQRIVQVFPELNDGWLLTGKGEMIINEANDELIQSINSKGAVPYWNLPVSAGQTIQSITGGLKPDGYIKGLPGADIAENILPVFGVSMEPEISSGALVGVKLMTNWDSLNTERIYLIITTDDRMIKRVEHDLENENILWCISPNYPRFKIFKTDIIEIHRVCFVYNPK